MREQVEQYGYKLTDVCHCGGVKTYNYDKMGNSFRFCIKPQSFSVKERRGMQYHTVESGVPGTIIEKLNKYAPLQQA